MMIVLPSVLIQLLIFFTIFLCNKIARDPDDVPARILRIGQGLLRMSCCWCLIFLGYNLVSFAFARIGVVDIGLVSTVRFLFPLVWCLASFICLGLILPLQRSLARRLC